MMSDDRQRRERVGLAVGLVGIGIGLFGFFAVGANLGFPVGAIFEQPPFLLSIVLAVGGLGVFLLGKRIATKNGEYESYWFG
jgi:hypothetical protein